MIAPSPMAISRYQFALHRAALVAPLLLAVAGCGGKISNYVPNPANPVFALVVSSRSTDTNGRIQLKAIAPSGSAAVVNWSVIHGGNDPSIGQGTIDSSGLYIPPASLTHDSIEVEVEAQLRSDPSKTATEVLEVTPGFLQPLTPESSTLATGGSVPVTAQLAEVGGGTIDWSLSTAPTGGRQLSSAYGTISQASCQRSPQDYTVCSAVYTAPAALPSEASSTHQDLYVVATLAGAVANGSRQPLHILLNDAGLSSTPLMNQSAQTSLVQLGSSGGNNNDADTSPADSNSASFVNDCCGGTLGALVRDQTGSQYILSNNHVLAESDQAGVGDTIVQPALIDANCDQNASRPVAWLRYVVPLATPQTNVDAALAEVNAGSVDPEGAILQLGAPGDGANGGIGSAAPAAGLGEAISPALFAPDSEPLRVAKSGRTTGLTCSTVDAIDLSVEIDYYKDCAETQPYYRKTFANQIGIGGDGFSDSGDSGALVVDAGNAQPLGLFFASGTDDRGGGYSVASPIQDVLTELSAQAGRQFSIVGGAEHPVSCLDYDSQTSAKTVPEALRQRALTAIHKSAPALINPLTGILDLEPGASADSPGEAAVTVYVDRKQNVQVPPTIGGLRTIVVQTDQSSLLNGTAPASPSFVPGIHLSAAILQQAAIAQQTYAKRLMTDPAIFGVGVTQSRDNPAEAALLVLVDTSRTPRATPAVLEGLRVRYVQLDRFHVTRSKHAGAFHPSSCAARSLVKNANTGETAFDPEQTAPLALPSSNR